MEEIQKSKTKEHNQINSKDKKTIHLLRLVMRFAGVFIVISAILAYVHSIYWLLFTVFVGVNLFQYSFTKFCPLEMILRRIIK
ncbi:MAG: DUF2892 domain-containing protein [Candidatus Nanoarchaeia archaeon]